MSLGSPPSSREEMRGRPAPVTGNERAPAGVNQGGTAEEVFRPECREERLFFLSLPPIKDPCKFLPEKEK